MGSMQAPASLRFGGVDYYSPSRAFAYTEREVLWSFGSEDSAGIRRNFVPVTILRLRSAVLAEGLKGKRVDHEGVTHYLYNKITNFNSTDDVFTSSFAETILIVDEVNESHLLPAIPLNASSQLLQAAGVRRIVAVNLTDAGERHLPEGPYCAGPQGLRLVYRCYQDPLKAFVTPVVWPWTRGDPVEIPPTGQVAVPSRIYFQNAPEAQPLAGLRFAIKDVFDLKDVETSNCCRAYLKWYGKASGTAPCIDDLISKGAVPVGKTKTVQFASGAHEIDWIDYQCAFNPRADGYQSPSMSSVGSATAVAGYDWLDFATGTDTFGSLIAPAAANGVFALRPTKGATDMRGIIPVSHYLDTAGFLCRSVEMSHRLARSWLRLDLNSSLPSKGRPKSVLYPEDLFPFQNKLYQEAVQQFVWKLGQWIGVKVESTDLGKRWLDDGAGDGRPLDEYLHNTIPHIQLHDCYKNSREFWDGYESEFGKTPYVDPVIHYKWTLGEKVTAAQYEQAKRERDTFRKWLTESVMAPSEWLVLPSGADSPNYRDQYFASAEESGKKVQGFGFDSLVMPALSGMPTFTVPVGQFAFTSKITGQPDVLPIVVTIMAAQGMDTSMIGTIAEFLDSAPRMHKQVATGPLAFPDMEKNAGLAYV